MIVVTYTPVLANLHSTTNNPLSKYCRVHESLNIICYSSCLIYKLNYYFKNVIKESYLEWFCTFKISNVTIKINFNINFLKNYIGISGKYKK